MKKNLFAKSVYFSLIVMLLNFSVSAQKRKPVQAKTRQIIFAVLNDGAMLEPVAYIEKGKLTPTVNGSDEEKIIAAFNKTYYQPKGKYNLVFAGVDAGNVLVKSSDYKAECSRNMATVSTVSTKAKLKGKVMALATNATPKTGTGVRRLPTAAERKEIEMLARDEFIKNNVNGNTAGNLKYQNLTALDVDGDDKAEMVGSFWVEPSADARGLLFFIAEKNAKGKYTMGFSEYRSVKKDEVMSGEVKDLDEGVYHELLLDTFDYDGDGVNDIFTYTQSFEGAGFASYKREKGKWTRAYEYSNYHCGY